jgi:hypothetical protein
MSIGRIPFATANMLSRENACPFSRGLAGVAAALVLLLPLSQARAGASLDVSPTAVAFSPLMVGFTSPKAQITVTNTGDVPLNHVSFAIGGPSLNDFLLTVGVCPTLQPQDRCTIKFVEFRPTAVGMRTAELFVKSEELPAQPVVQLAGEALAPAPKLATSTDELDFNDQVINTPSAPMMVRLLNVGAQSLDITGPSITPQGDFNLAASDCNVALASPLTGLIPTSCTVSVEFTPRSTGWHQATLTITSTDPDGPKQVTLRGRTAHSFLMANPPLLQFGSALVGDPTYGAITKTFDLTNVGTADAVIPPSSFTFFGYYPDAHDFTVLSGLPCTLKAGSGQACTVTVRFQPHGSGQRGDTIKILSADGAQAEVSMTGFGEVFLPTPPPGGAASDVLFCSADLPAAGATCLTDAPQYCAGADQTLVRSIPVTRAFASNNPGAPALPQPTIAAAVASGAMGPAVLELMALGLGPAGSHGVALNGTGVGSINVPGDGQWHLATITVPQGSIRFPGVAAIGSPPAPTPNIVAMTPDLGRSGACISVAWVRLRIKAMSPVIFIHGMSSNGAFFTRQAIAGSLTLLGPAGATFLGPTPGSFLAAGIPTDTSINLPGTASVAANAATLSTLIPGIVRSFGASNVHIVAHDKGGLDAREWLSINAAIDKASVIAPFSVISFTTLSTPHQGTAAADLRVALQTSALGVLPVTALSALGFGVVSPATLDLTTIAAPALALTSPLPTGVDYRGVGGDADRNSNGFIQTRPLPDEYIAERGEQPLLAAMFAASPAATDTAVSAFYQFMLATRTVVVVPIILPVPFPPFLLFATVPAPVPGIPSPNDLVVTAPSALIASPFVPLPPFLGPRGVDHASVAGPLVGAAIIPLLRASDTTRGGLR